MAALFGKAEGSSAERGETLPRMPSTGTSWALSQASRLSSRVRNTADEAEVYLVHSPLHVAVAVVVWTEMRRLGLITKEMFCNGSRAS
jgi:hypothetical protein